MSAAQQGEAPPLTPRDRRYFQHRAEAETDLAQQASHPRAVRSHYQMAERYLDRVYGSPERDPT